MQVLNRWLLMKVMVRTVSLPSGRHLSRLPLDHSHWTPTKPCTSVSLWFFLRSVKFFSFTIWKRQDAEACIICSPLKISCWKASAQVSPSRSSLGRIQILSSSIQIRRRPLSPSHSSHHLLAVILNLCRQSSHLQSRDNKSGHWI